MLTQRFKVPRSLKSCDCAAQRVFVVGLATDYCVRAAVETALQIGFEAIVLQDAVRAVNVHPGDGDAALHALLASGAHPERIEHLIEAKS